MIEMQKDLIILLTKYITNDDIIKGIMLVLQTENQQLEMIQYLIKNKNIQITEEQILNKMQEIIN